MANYQSYYALVSATGKHDAVSRFAHRHLAQRGFSFETLRPTPSVLAKDFASDVEDAFDALYGDWTPVAGRYRFLETAAGLGFPFPLASREQVIACHEALVPHGPDALDRARAYQRNIGLHGAGHAAAWQKINWDVDTDASQTVALIEPDGVTVSFELGCALSDKLLKMYSSDHPELQFDICTALSSGKRPKRQALRNGKKIALSPEAVATDIHPKIIAFRTSQGLAWLSKWVSPALVVRTVTMSDEGKFFLKDNQVSLDFALARIRNGEDPVSLQARFPEITDEQVALLAAISAADQQNTPDPGLHS